MAGRFTQKCWCVDHVDAISQFPELESVLLLKSNTRKWPRSVIATLVHAQKWPVTGTAICEACVTYAKQTYNVGEQPQHASKRRVSDAKILLPVAATVTTDKKSKLDVLESSTTSVPDANEVIRSITNGLYTDIEIGNIASAIGKQLAKQLRIYTAKKLPSDRNTLLQCTSYSSQWKSPDCQLFKSFVSSCLNLESMSEERRKSAHRYLQKSLECLCAACNDKFVSLSAHRENIILHAFSGSKLACEIYGHAHPAGSYKTVLQTIQCLGREKPSLPPEKDLYLAFDNQQIIGREYRVTYQGGQRTSTVTSVSAFVDQNSPNLQQVLEIPTALEFPLKNEDALKTRLLSAVQKYNDRHANRRLEFITKRLKIVLQEWNNDCGSLDNGQTQSFMQTLDYEDGLSHEFKIAPQNKVSIENQSNLLINPNSIVRVQEVLDKLVDLCDASDPLKKWFVTHCDGLPYTIALKLIKNVFSCSNCNEFGSLEAMNAHKCQNGETAGIVRKYSKIVLRPGSGHFEINFVRSIFKVYFSIFIEPVAKMLNYSTPKALKYCMNAVDHHKSWQILKIVYLSLADELLHLFVANADPKLDKTVDNLSLWINEIANKNYSMAFDFVFTRLHSLFMFRSGIRQTNDDESAAALHKCSAIFYGFNHPRYREIYSNDLLYLLTLPKVAFNFVRKYSLCVEGSESGQGIDMLLEEQNKEQKNWLISHGVPTDYQWEFTSANLSALQKTKQSVLEELGVSQLDGSYQHVNLGREYLGARQYFRQVLQNAPSRHLQSFTDPPVNVEESFLNCSKICEQNQLSFLLAGLQNTKCNMEYVQSSPIANLEDKEVKRLIVSLIKKLPDELKAYYTSRLETERDEDLRNLYFEATDDVADYNASFV